jgi:hypothetical protein
VETNGTLNEARFIWCRAIEEDFSGKYKDSRQQTTARSAQAETYASPKSNADIKTMLTTAPKRQRMTIATGAVDMKPEHWNAIPEEEPLEAQTPPAGDDPGGTAIGQTIQPDGIVQDEPPAVIDQAVIATNKSRSSQEEEAASQQLEISRSLLTHRCLPSSAASSYSALDDHELFLGWMIQVISMIYYRGSGT